MKNSLNLLHPKLLSCALLAHCFFLAPPPSQAEPPATVSPVLAKSPQEEAKTFQLPPGYRMELVVSEPEIKEPGVVAFDGDGRMFVAELRGYMQDIDGKNQLDKISQVSLHWSSKGDGVYDKHTVFIDKLILPRMLVALDKGRIIVGETNTNDLFIYSDTDGDGVSDKKEPFYIGGGRGGNLEHQPNGMIWAIDNGLYSTYNNYRLRWTAAGKTACEIGGILKISERTVNFHVQNVMEKFGVHNKTHAAAKAMGMGLFAL